MDTLSKFSHDSDPEVAYTAIFAMGLIGAGTNNARLAGLLRQLAQFYCKDQNSLYMVRIAQVCEKILVTMVQSGGNYGNSSK